MSIVARKMYVVTCPRCGEPLDLDGEGTTVFKTAKDAEIGLGCAGTTT